MAGGGELDDRQRRVGENEALFRDVNERLRDISEGVAPTDEFELFCECGDASCVARLTMRLDDYERLRSDPTRFVIKPGHEVPSLETIVETKNGYTIVEKRVGEAAKIASEHDPRT